jgi:hypothetical protein
LKLPLKSSIEEGKATLASVFKSVSAFYDRKNQFQEVYSQVRRNKIIKTILCVIQIKTCLNFIFQSSYNLSCSWSVNCRELQIKSPLSCFVTGKDRKQQRKKDITIMFILKYEEDKYLPISANAALCKCT